MQLPIVASLWVGGPLSYIEQLCLKSFLDHGHRVVLYHYGEVPNVPEGVEVFDARLIMPREHILRHGPTGSPAVHSYKFRYQLLEVQNVIWVDLDMLCLKPWDFADQWVFGWQVEGRLAGPAALGLPRFSKTLAKLNGFCRDEAPEVDWSGAKKAPIAEQELNLWGAAGLTHFLEETGEGTRILPQTAFYPLAFKHRRDLLEPGVPRAEIYGRDSYGLHLWNRRLSRWIVNVMNGRVPEDSVLGEKLAEHGIDQDAAPALDPRDEMDKVEATPTAPAPVSAPVSKSKPAKPKPAAKASGDADDLALPADTARPMARRPIDPNLPTVASLWIGGTLSYIEQLCLLSFRDFGHRTVLYTYGGVNRVPEGIEVLDANELFPQTNFLTHKKSGSPAVHADAFRYRMIAKEPMIWVDTDMLCVRPWDFGDAWVFGWEKTGRLVCNAVLGLPKSSKTLASLNALCATEYPIPPWAKPDERARLEAARDAGDPVHVSELEWGVWGPAAVTHFLKESGEISRALPQEAFFPVSFKDRRELLAPNVDLSDRVNHDCYGVHLWNRRIRRRIVTHEQGVPDPDSLMGRAMTRHRVDPRLAPIPDHPPPGSPTQMALASELPASRLAKQRTQTEQRAGAFADAPRNVTDDAADPNELWQTVGLAAPDTGSEPVSEGEDDEENIAETPDNSNNPNVVLAPCKALREMPVMALQQSPEYQRYIDDLEGRTGNITGYLKDPDAPIKNDKILVVTSMKNESPFILEWIAYHKSIGVDHFLVYTNDCTDNTNDILDRLDALGHVTRVPNPWDPASGKKPQHVALKDALKQPAYKQADWVLTIDVDEFVNIHVGEGTFDDLFRACNYPNVISFTWKFFGNKDIHHYEDRPIMEQFTACAPEFIPKPRLGWGFKSMFHKSSPYNRIGVHRPLGIEDEEADQVRWVNGSGRAMPDMLLTNNGWRSTKRSLGYRLATLNHYILRSTESFLVKRERGRINHTEHDQGIDYWTRRNYATETDDRIIARMPRMQVVLDELMGDKKLAKMHRDAVKWHQKRIAKLLGDPDYKSLYDDLTQPGRPDALTLAKEAEAEEQAQEQQARDDMAHRADKPRVSLRAAAPLKSLRMVSPPATAAIRPVHERFNDARKLAGRIKGFLWEGPENALIFAPRSKRLVVVFDNISTAREEGQRWPWGFKALWQDMGCSVLGVMCTQRNWFRQDFVHDAFEGLRDQGFFEQFDEILFYGASMGAFGALVYAQCAPGANVLAVAPQSTLDRRIMPDDDRWGWTARLDWDGRFNDAADVLENTGQTFIVADPYFAPDKAQVERIRGERITWLKTAFMGHQLPNAFVVMGILKPMLLAAAGGTLTPELFYRLFRARSDLPRFQHDLLMQAEARGKLKSAIRICEYTLKKRKAQNIKRTLDRLQDELAKQQRKEAAE